MIDLLKKLLSICQSLSKGNPTRISGDSLNLLEAPNKDLGAASPTLRNPRLNYVCDAGFCELYLILLAFRPGGGYSHTLPIRVCAAQRGRDFEAPDLERGIHFKGVF